MVRNEDVFDEHEGAEFDSGCGSGRHDLCVHVLGDAGLLLLAGRDLEELDPGSSSLCLCPCHADCPMTREMNGAGWPELCDCQGTQTIQHFRHSRRDRPPDVASVLRKSIDRNRKARKARDAVRARAASHDRQDLSTILDEEWTRQGLDPPVEPLRGMELDRLLRPASRRADNVRLNADVGLALLRLPFKIAGLFQQSSSAPDDPEGDVATDERASVFRIRATADPVEVLLDEDAPRRLAHFGADGLFAPSALRADQVELRIGADRSLEVWEFTLFGVNRGPSHRLGTVRAEASGPFLRPTAAAARVGQPAVCNAMRSTTGVGTWRLHLMGLRRR